MSVPVPKIKTEPSVFIVPGGQTSRDSVNARSTPQLRQIVHPEFPGLVRRELAQPVPMSASFSRASSARNIAGRDPCSEPKLKRRKITNAHGDASEANHTNNTVTSTRHGITASALLRGSFFESQQTPARGLDMQGVREAPIPSDVIRKICKMIEPPDQIPELHQVSKAFYRGIDSAYPLRRTHGLITDLCVMLGAKGIVNPRQFDEVLSMINVPGKGYDVTLLTPMGTRLRNLGLLMLLHWAGGLPPTDRGPRICKLMESLRLLDAPDLAMALRDFAVIFACLPGVPTGSDCLIPAIAGHIRSLPQSRACTDMLRTVLLQVAPSWTDFDLNQMLLNLATPGLRIELGLYAVVHQGRFAASPFHAVFGLALPAQTAILTGNPDIIIAQLDALTVTDRTTALLEIAALLELQLSDHGEIDKHHPYGDHPITPWPRIPVVGICPALEVMRIASNSLAPIARKEMITNLSRLLALHFTIPRPRFIPEAHYVQCITEGLKIDSKHWQGGLALCEHWRAWPATEFTSPFEPRMRSEAYLLRELASDARLLDDSGATRSIHQSLKRAAMKVPVDAARALLFAWLDSDEEKAESRTASITEEAFSEPWALSPDQYF